MPLYPPIEPFSSGMLDVGDGNQIYWEGCGNPGGKPVIVLHGGPGSGCTPWFRQLFDPAVYRVILFDQRNCGRSTPNASDRKTDLTHNTTLHLVQDIERLRQHLGIEAWQVLGGSWGSVLALAYAESHPEQVTAMVLFGVATGLHRELDWLFRGGLSSFFPEQWEDLRAAVPPNEREGDLVEQYHRLLNHPDPEVCQEAAREWALWESATPTWPPAKGLLPRFQDPVFALAFARIVTHFVRHNLWLEDGILLANIDRLAGIPSVLINGRFDFQSPIGNAWDLHCAWPGSKLIIVNDAGHSAGNAGITDEIIKATDAFGLRSKR